jgi:hypothetical protein
MGAYEIEITGSLDNVFNALERLPEITEKISHALKMVAPVREIPSSAPRAPGLPPPPVVSARTCCDAIMQLLSTDWGKSKPRTLREITEALTCSTLHYPISTIGKSLQRLVKRGKLRRWKEKEGYVYVAT